MHAYPSLSLSHAILSKICVCLSLSHYCFFPNSHPQPKYYVCKISSNILEHRKWWLCHFWLFVVMQTIAASQYSSIPHADPEDHTSVAPDGDGTHCSGLGAEQFEMLLNKQLNGSRSALKVVSQSFRSIPVYPHQFSEHQRRVRQNYNDMSGATRNSDLRGDSNALLVLFDRPSALSVVSLRKPGCVGDITQFYCQYAHHTDAHM